MTKIVANPRECCIEFQIKDGLIKEVDFLGKGDTNWQKYSRKEEDKIKWVLSLTIQDDFEAFKQVLCEIKKDEKFCLYAKNLLASERVKWEHALEDYQEVVKKKVEELQQEAKQEINRLQELIDKYTWLE